MKKEMSKFRALNVAELNEQLADLQKRQFKLKLQHAIGELKEKHHLSLVRKDIARVLGLLTEKKGSHEETA